LATFALSPVEELWRRESGHCATVERGAMVIKRSILGASFIVLASVFVIFFIKKPQAETPADPGPGPPPSPQAGAQQPVPASIAVKVADVRRGELIIRLRSPGEAVTDRRIAIKTEVPGVVKELKVREGLHVKPGDLLAALDDERYRLALRRQEATRLRLLSEMLLEKQFGQSTDQPGVVPEKLAKAKSDFARAEAGFRKGLISQTDLAKASQDYDLALIESGMRKEEVMAASKGLTQAEVDVQMAELDLERTIIRAPFAGIITDIKVSPGEHAEPGRVLFTLVDIGEIKIIARVLESEVGKMRAGRGVDLRFSAHPDKVFKGTVEAISPVVNPEDKTCAVHIAVENPQEEIKPGMHAEVEIAAEVHKDRLLVPEDAVLVRGGRKLVFVVEEGLAKWRYIEVGLENESWAEVLDGVMEGEEVIVEGHFTLAHDTAVSITR
jgi:membrane fusion protein, multidrug efflux system